MWMAIKAGSLFDALPEYRAFLPACSIKRLHLDGEAERNYRYLG